jgi:DNA-binding transcriptional ArsR family regulator
MVKHSTEILDRVFAALSDPTRRAILEQLSGRDSAVSELAEPHRMSLPAVSKHLRVLERAGLIQREVEGRVHMMHLESEPLKDAVTWLEHYSRFWEGRFDELEKILTNQSNTEEDQ